MGIDLAVVKLNANLLWRLMEQKANNSKRDTITIDSEFRNFLENMPCRKPVHKPTCEYIAIIFIGTGKYIEYFKKFYDTSRKLFLPNTPKTYFVFTDDVDCADLHAGDGIEPVETAAEEGPFSTLYRFRYINRIDKRGER